MGSIEEAEAILTVAATALDTLWKNARKSWTDAFGLPKPEDKRRPTYVVIDEAHNLCPSAPTTPLADAVVEKLARIAAEGRKYGLFLVLVTQRPSKVHLNVLSQCDNLCLMKMANRLDAEIVEQTFGFLPAGAAAQAAHFQKGDAMLAGRWTRDPVRMHAAPRRTAEGGRDLPKDWLR